MWWELEEETYPPAPTSLAPTLLLHKPGARIPAELGRLRVAGVGHWLPRTRTLPTSTDSVWPAQGVFICICSSTSLTRSLAHSLAVAQSISNKRSIKLTS